MRFSDLGASMVSRSRNSGIYVDTRMNVHGPSTEILDWGRTWLNCAAESRFEVNSVGQKALAISYEQICTLKDPN